MQPSRVPAFKVYNQRKFQTHKESWEEVQNNTRTNEDAKYTSLNSPIQLTCEMQPSA